MSNLFHIEVEFLKYRKKSVSESVHTVCIEFEKEV